MRSRMNLAIVSRARNEEVEDHHRNRDEQNRESEEEGIRLNENARDVENGDENRVPKNDVGNSVAIDEPLDVLFHFIPQQDRR